MCHTNCWDRTETISSLVKVNLGHPFLTLAYSRGISFHFGVKLHRTMAILIEDLYFFSYITKDTCFNKCLQNKSRLQCINWPLLFGSTIALCVFCCGVPVWFKAADSTRRLHCNQLSLALSLWNLYGWAQPVCLVCISGHTPILGQSVPISSYLMCYAMITHLGHSISHSSARVWQGQ